MSARPWKPSPRAQQLIPVLWDAFDQGDRWVRIEHPSTARYTGMSLVWNGIAEQDVDDERRFRLSEAQLNANGLTRVVRQFAGITFGAVCAIQEAIEIEEAA